MVGIVFIQDIRYCPYLGRYTQPLEKLGIPFEIICWERWDTPPETPLPLAAEGAQKCHIFRKPSEMARSPFRKAGDFAAFSRFAREILRQKKYDRLIVLTTMSGILLYDLLTGRYRGRYIFDIRDASYERFSPFRAMEARLTDASSFTCISSEGFLEILPKGRNYVLTDNFVDGDIQAGAAEAFHKKAPGEPITLSYIGFIRYFSENRTILNKLVCDPRFTLCYHGTGADYQKLLEYQAEAKSDRLKVTGYFDYEREKPTLCRDADMINNYYPRTLEIQRLATTNKAYDGMIFKRPQLVACGTYLQKLVERWRIGCALDANQPDFADRLFAYYQGLDETVFSQNAAAALETVRARDAVYRERIYAFLSA